jgi:exodeoxyribonuclease V gamma subunit
LQPFSRKYFEPQAGQAPGQAPGERLITYASEWRAAHVEPELGAVVAGSPPTGTDADDAFARMTIASLANFLRNPVKEFFKRRLQVSFDGIDGTAQDDESFSSGGLERWALLDEVLRESRRQLDTLGAGTASNAASLVAGIVQTEVARLKRAGRLPVAGPGQIVEAEIGQTLVPMVARWQAARDAYPCARDKLPAQMTHPQHPKLAIDDWLVGLRSADAAGPSVWIELQASKVADEGSRAGPRIREDKLIGAWVRCLVSAACGHPAQGIVIGAGAAVHVTPPEAEQAAAVLAALMLACHAGLSGSRPLPTAVQTGLAFLRDPAKAWLAYEGSDFSPVPGEGQEACLARLYPDFAALSAQQEFEPATRLLYEPYRDWLANHVHVEMLSGDSGTEGADHD